MSLSVVVEGDTDFPVMRKLAADAGLEIDLEIDSAGKGMLDKKLKGYNNAAQGSPWLIVRDLDRDAPCAPKWIAKKRFVPSNWMCFRIAVRELEAWLLADAEGLATFMNVEASWVPSDPDVLADPTVDLVNLARRARKGTVRRAMVPPPDSGAQVGALYEATIIEFGADHWSLDRAVARSPSLLRARTRLRSLGERWRAHVAGQS
jgi:hypothetical protein